MAVQYGNNGHSIRYAAVCFIEVLIVCSSEESYVHKGSSMSLTLLVLEEMVVC